MSSRTFTIQNTLDDLPKVAEWVGGLDEDLGLPFQVVFRLDMVLAEALANVIEHAFPDGGTHDIQIDLTVTDELATLDVIDPGVAFDPLSVAEAKQADNLQDVDIGGLGVHLIRNFMDEVSYRREGDKNILTMSVSTDADDE